MCNMLSIYEIRKFVKQNKETLSSIKEVVLVKCDNISSKKEKSLKGLLEGIGVTVKDWWYIEKGLGSMGIPIALKDYIKSYKTGFYAITIRGRWCKPKLLYVSESGNIKRLG